MKNDASNERLTGIMSELKERGILKDTSDLQGIQEMLAEGRQTVYCGFDPTASSLHIGNLLPLLTLKRFTLAGHNVIALMGGGTGLIGDPSGKATERTLNTEKTVKDWVANIERQVNPILKPQDSDGLIRIVDNYEWHGSMSMISYLRDTGKHFSVSGMLARDSVKTRIGSEVGISYTEFSYMLLQSIDFVELNQRYGCLLQVGGSDQWGNMVSGIDLIRRTNGQQAYCATFPLLTTSEGKKFGKSEGNAVWLDSEQTSPYAFYQFWMNRSDEDAIRFMKMFTFLNLDEISEIERTHLENPSKRSAQKKLAFEVTKIVHGEDNAASAQEATEFLFGNGSKVTLSDNALNTLFNELGGIDCDRDMKLTGVLVKAGLTTSSKEARRLIVSNSATVNGEVIDDINTSLSEFASITGNHYILKVGKKKYGIVRVIDNS